MYVFFFACCHFPPTFSLTCFFLDFLDTSTKDRKPPKASVFVPAHTPTTQVNFFCLCLFLFTSVSFTQVQTYESLKREPPDPQAPDQITKTTPPQVPQHRTSKRWVWPPQRIVRPYSRWRFYLRQPTKRAHSTLRGDTIKPSVNPPVP